MTKNFGALAALALIVSSSSFAADTGMRFSAPDTLNSGCGPMEYAQLDPQRLSNTEFDLKITCVPIVCIYQKVRPWPYSAFSSLWEIYLSPDPDKRTDLPRTATQLKMLNDNIDGDSARDTLLGQFTHDGTCQYSKEEDSPAADM